MKLHKFTEGDRFLYRLVADNHRVLMTSRSYGREDARDYAFEIVNRSIWPTGYPDDIE